jgi:hypothetical protein
MLYYFVWYYGVILLRCYTCNIEDIL